MPMSFWRLIMFLLLAEEGDAVAHVGATVGADADEPDEVPADTGGRFRAGVVPARVGSPVGGREEKAGEVELAEPVDRVDAVRSRTGQAVVDRHEDVFVQQRLEV